MSLGRLLSAGKSLVGLNSGSRYQLRTGALPKFGSQKNPFAAPGESSAAEPLTPAEMAAASLKDTQRLPLLIPKPAAGAESIQAERPEIPVTASPSAAPKGATLSIPVEVPSVVNGWLKKLNPLVWWDNRKPAEPKSAIPRFSKSVAPIQGELSLDNIKVMRNDLS